MINKQRFVGLVTAVTCVFALSANASVQTQDWDFDNSNPSGPDNSTKIQGGDAFGNYITWIGEDGIRITVTAWSETINDSSFCSDFPADPACQVGTGSSESTERDPYIADAKLKYYSSGLGIENRDGEGGAPQHSIDNIPNSSNWGYNDYDAVLVQFSRAVSLTELNLGWATNDGDGSSDGAADLSLLAYGGNAFSGSFSSSSTWGDLLTSGWSKIGDYENAGNVQTISTSVESKFWLISAYNPIFGGILSNANDGFKLAGLASSFTHTPPPSTDVPEPGTLAILAIGLGGLLMRRRPKA